MTAIMRAEHQEPEVARFIDSYKYDQQTAERRQKYGGGTSLPLDSDGYEDRQRKLKEELRNDFLVQQEKPSDPVYFRVGTPEQGLRGLGQYEHLRQEMNIKRQREYNDFLREKKNLELQKIEARRNRPPPPVTQPPAGQIDYDQQNLRARTEDRRAYQDHMGKYHQTQAVTVKPPINYEEERRRLSEELKQEYNQFMEKKAQEERYWRMRGKPVTPPGGLDIGHYDKHVKEQAPQKKKEYKETLDQQRNEKLHHRAWERVADISPSHMHYRDEERPLVGSPRDVNFYMREKEEKDKFALVNRDLKPDLKTKDTPLDKSSSTYQHHVARQLAKRDEENFTRYLEVEKEKRKNQKKYREELLKQQKEQMYIRARQEPEMPVLDRSPPQQATYLASKPPPGPQQGHLQRDQAFRTEQYVHQAPQQVSQTENLHQTMNGHNQMNRPHAPLPRSPEKFRKSSPTLMALDKQFEDQSQRTQPKSQITNSGVTGYQPSFQEPGQRQPERPRPTPSAFQTHPNTGGNYANEGAVERLPLRESRNFDNQEEPTAPKENPPIGGLYVFDDTKHDKIKRQIYEMKKKDYAEYLQRKQDEEQRRHEEVRRHRGTPAGFQKDHHYSSDEYEKFQRNLQKQEGEEYREFLKKKNQEVRNREWNFGNSGVLDLRGDDENQSRKQLLREERQKEYNEFMNQQRIRDPPRRNDYFDPRNGPYDGIFSGLGDHGNTKEVLGQQRKQEYNQYLDQYPQTKAGGRPTWVKETLPNNTDRGRSPMRNPQPVDHYQQMLDEKRREEAQRRRFDDPEYQGRLPPNSREARYNEDMQQQKYGYYQQE